MKTVIHWFRRDLRICDNVALNEAVKRAQTVVPVFIFEQAFRRGPDVGAARTAFLLKSVEALKKNLAELGYSLVIRCGNSETILPVLAREVGAQCVFANRRYEPYTRRRDERVASSLLEMGVGMELYKDAVLWEADEILTLQGKPYTVFTPYSRTWKSRTITAPKPKIKPQTAQQVNVQCQSDTLPASPDGIGLSLRQTVPPAGERAALEALRHFMGGPVFQYAQHRDFPALAAGSGLSPHLRAGTIGIRTILAELLKARNSTSNTSAIQSCDVFLNELIWREFYIQVLHNFPHVSKGAFNSEYDRLPWPGSDELFEAWCAGMTGYPIVDAAMRCLNATGTMHNRLRMIAAMFLTKDLLIHWQKGERYFMRQLVDGDMAANNGGWQWCAGTGTDAAPYFRIFNPVTQAMKFDPEGAFVRRWVPELEDFAGDSIHRPWENPLLFTKSGYIGRIVEHEMQRQQCLAMFQGVRKR